MDKQRRFSGGQVTTIIVALAVVAVGTPATVFAATGTSVRLVDGSNSHHAASVSKSGALKVARTRVAPSTRYRVSRSPTLAAETQLGLTP